MSLTPTLIGFTVAAILKKSPRCVASHVLRVTILSPSTI